RSSRRPPRRAGRYGKSPATPVWRRASSTRHSTTTRWRSRTAADSDPFDRPGVPLVSAGLEQHVQSYSPGRKHMKSRRLVLLLGVLAVAVAGAVSAAVLTTSSSSSALGHSVKKADAPAITRFEKEGERAAVTFAEEDYNNRAYPSSNINFAQVQAAHDAAMRINARVGQGSNLNSWQSVGPNGINVDPLATQTDGPATNWSGRITAIGTGPSCTKYNCRVYIAAAGGGIWRANDGLAMHPTWKQISDGQIPSNAIGYLLVDPTDPSGATIYAGTGEPNGSSDSEAGVGVYRSTDYGDHWSLLPGSVAVAQDRAVGGIAIDPNNRSHIFIATD